MPWLACADCLIPEELWELLRTNPDAFWDNRNSKVNPRAPDFVHKDNGDALWASSDPPQWYLEQNAYTAHTGPQLEPVMQGDAMDQTQISPADNFSDIESGDAAPADFPSGASWDAPGKSSGTDRWGGSGGSYFGGAGAAPATGYHTRSKGSGAGDMAALWEEFRGSPQSFWDNRENKRNPRAPDFKHKQTGKGLWMESAPEWFDPSQVPAYKGVVPLPAEAAAKAVTRCLMHVCQLCCLTAP